MPSGVAPGLGGEAGGLSFDGRANALEDGHNALSEESHVEFGLLVRHATEGQFGHQVV